MKGISKPGRNTEDHEALQASEPTIFLTVEISGVYEMYLLEIATGLRRGELLGLKWIDVDYNEGTIHVRRQICRIDGTVTEGPLKTKNSYRKIVVPADVMDVLKKKQAKDDGASEYVFYSPLTNGPISPDSVLHMLHRVLDRAGLPRIRFHDLRHRLAGGRPPFVTS